MLPVGVLATWKVRRAVGCPIHRRRRRRERRRTRCSTCWPARRSSAIGTAALRDPRAPERDRARARCVVPRARRDERCAELDGHAGVDHVMSARPDRRARRPDAAQALDARRASSARVPVLQGRERAVHGGGPGDRARSCARIAARRVSRSQVPRHPEHGRKAAYATRRRLDARLVTVHASGGRGDARAAVRRQAGQRCGVLAVTVLTSLDVAGDVATAWGRDEVARCVRRGRCGCRRSGAPRRARTGSCAAGRSGGGASRIRGPARNPGARSPAGRRRRRTTRRGS